MAFVTFSFFAPKFKTLAIEILPPIPFVSSSFEVTATSKLISLPRESLIPDPKSFSLTYLCPSTKPSVI